ncbi:hypothetical protein ACA910_019652 [Epithemia clementina (nom. ined.)]
MDSNNDGKNESLKTATVASPPLPFPENQSVNGTGGESVCSHATVDVTTKAASSTTTTTTKTTTRPSIFVRFRRRNNNNDDVTKTKVPPLARPRRAFSAPAATGRRRRRRRLLEDHYRVDPERRVVLPGVPHYDPNLARDLHDFFNLIVLIPVVALNVMNWNWDLILRMYLFSGSHDNDHHHHNHHHHHHHLSKAAISGSTLADAWTGEWFDLFFMVTAVYFLIDLAWILIIPDCVKSPSTIIQHHIATLLYIMIPYQVPDLRWAMGACMIVEINTWFLIARRVFNKQGFPPWIIDLSFVSFRVKLISVLFYFTWIVTRCIIYPYLLPLFYQAFINQTRKVGTPWNLVALAVPLHTLFCLLNLKWTYDLLMSKIRFWTRKNKKEVEKIDKGL